MGGGQEGGLGAPQPPGAAPRRGAGRTQGGLQKKIQLKVSETKILFFLADFSEISWKRFCFSNFGIINSKFLGKMHES